MKIICKKCGNEETVKLHKDGYEVVYGTCSYCMQWCRKFVVPSPKKLKDVRQHLVGKAHVAQG